MTTTDDRVLLGQHALVTGAGRGLGRACALALGRAGASLTLMARSADQLDEVAAEAQALGVDAHAVVGDVTDEDDVQRAVDAAQRHGDLHICVNNAGVNRPRPATETSLADWDLVLDTNVRGGFLVCRAMGAALIARGRGGRIVNMSSQLGAVGFPGRVAYCTSKHAINGMTKALAVEWAEHAITVNAVAPTFIETPLTAAVLADPEFRAEVLRRIPMGRLGTPDEVAAAVVFLASPQASLITGTILPVDGGWLAW